MYGDKRRGLTGLLLKSGLVKTEFQATTVLVGVVAACVIFTLMNMSGSASDTYGNLEEMKALYPESFE